MKMTLDGFEESLVLCGEGDAAELRDTSKTFSMRLSVKKKSLGVQRSMAFSVSEAEAAEVGGGVSAISSSRSLRP